MEQLVRWALQASLRAQATGPCAGQPSCLLPPCSCVPVFSWSPAHSPALFSGERCIHIQELFTEGDFSGGFQPCFWIFLSLERKSIHPLKLNSESPSWCGCADSSGKKSVLFPPTALSALLFLLSACLFACGLPRWLSNKESACQRRRHRRCGFSPWVGRGPWRRKWQPTPVFLPGKSHGQRRQRSLAAYSSWGPKE